MSKYRIITLLLRSKLLTGVLPAVAGRHCPPAGHPALSPPPGAAGICARTCNDISQLKSFMWPCHAPVHAWQVDLFRSVEILTDGQAHLLTTCWFTDLTTRTLTSCALLLSPECILIKHNPGLSFAFLCPVASYASNMLPNLQHLEVVTTTRGVADSGALAGSRRRRRRLIVALNFLLQAACASLAKPSLHRAAVVTLFHTLQTSENGRGVVAKALVCLSLTR